MDERDLQFGTYSSQFELLHNADGTRTLHKISRYVLGASSQSIGRLLRDLQQEPHANLLSPEGYNAVAGQHLHEFYPYLEIPTLEQLRHNIKSSLRYGTLDETIFMDMMLQVSAAASALHARGWIHRDIRPSNIFVDTSGSELRLRLFDYGNASEPYVQHTPVHSWNVEHPPELKQGNTYIDQRFDVYSIGRIFFELTHDLSGEVESSLDLSNPLFEVIEKAIAELPNRYNSVDEMRQHLLGIT